MSYFPDAPLQTSSATTVPSTVASNGAAPSNSAASVSDTTSSNISISNITSNAVLNSYSSVSNNVVTTATDTMARKPDSLIQRDIRRLQDEVAKLESLLSQFAMLNKELQQIVDNRYPSPSHKRLLVEELERTHNISRRHACKLLNLARSSFWYKSTSRKPFPLRAKLPRTPLTDLDRIRLLKSLSNQVLVRGTALDSSTMSFIEVSLKILGMRSAANLVRGNLKLAMEFFEHYVKYKKL